MAPDHAHTAAIRIDAPAAFAFACLSDPRQVGRWALGCMDLRPAGAEGVWRGHSLLDGAEGFVEIRPRPDLWLIDFLVGSLTARSPRISIRLMPGPAAGIGEDACLAAMTAWRLASMDAARWAQLIALHEAEAHIFRAQIEAAWRGAGR